MSSVSIMHAVAAGAKSVQNADLVADWVKAQDGDTRMVRVTVPRAFTYRLTNGGFIQFVPGEQACYACLLEQAYVRAQGVELVKKGKSK